MGEDKGAGVEVSAERVPSHPLSRVDSTQDDDGNRASNAVSAQGSNLLSTPANKPDSNQQGKGVVGDAPALTVADMVEASVENSPFTLPDPEDIGALMQSAVPAGAFTAQQGNEKVNETGMSAGSGGKAADVADVKVESSVEDAPFAQQDPEDVGAVMQNAVPAGAFIGAQHGGNGGEEASGEQARDQTYDPVGDALKDIGRKLKDTTLSENTNQDPSYTGAAPAAGDNGRNIKGGGNDGDAAYEKHPPQAKPVPDGQENGHASHNVVQVDKLADDPVKKKMYDTETTRMAPGATAGLVLPTPAELEAEVAAGGVVLGVNQLGMDKSDQPNDPNTRGKYRFSALTGILGPGMARAKEPTGKEVKDAQQEVVMHDPASGRPHIVGQDGNMGYAVDDPRHPRNVGRVGGDSSFVEKAEEKVELAAEGMYDDVTGGLRSGKDSAGIPGGQLHNFKTAAGDIKEAAKNLPEKAGEASGTVGQLASNMEEYVEKKVQGVKDTINTADMTSVDERLEQQHADVARRQRQLDSSEADPWGEGHEKLLKNLRMDNPPAEKKESFLDHLLHPFSKKQHEDTGPARDIAESYKEYVEEKGDNRVDHMRASAEADTSKLPSGSAEAEQAHVNLSEGVRGDRTGYIMERAAQAGHEHPDPLEKEKKNLEEQVAHKGYQMPHPVWRSQPTADQSGEPQVPVTQEKPLSPKTMADKIKQGLSHLAELGKEALEARGAAGVPKSREEERHSSGAQAAAMPKGGTAEGMVKEAAAKVQSALPISQQKQAAPAAGADEGLIPGKEVDSTTGDNGPAGGPPPAKGPLMAVGRALAHIAGALEPHAKHPHHPTQEQHPEEHMSDIQQERDARPKANAPGQGKGGAAGAQFMSRDNHSTLSTVAKTTGEAIGTMEGPRQAFADKLSHVREQLSEHAPDIPDTTETSTDQILKEREQQAAQASGDRKESQ